MVYFQITFVLVHSCPDLLLHLDFLGVNPTPIQTMIKNSQNIRMEEVSLDMKYKNRQQLKIAFSNVGTTALISLGVNEAIKVRNMRP